MATVIQAGPSGWDSALAAFSQSFRSAQDLYLEKKKLEIERQRVASQTNLESAEAGAAKARTRDLDAQLQDLADTQQGNAVAAGLINHLDDPMAIANAVHGLSPNVAAKAITHFGELQSAAGTRAHVQAMADLTQAQAAEAQRAERTHVAVQDVLRSYGGRLNTPEGAHGAIADVGTIDPVAAGQLANALLPQLEGDWQPVHGANGHLIMVERRKGTVRDTGVDLGVGGTGGGATAQTSKQESIFALDNLIKSIDDMNNDVRTDDNSDINPVLASLIGGAHVSVPGASTGAAGARGENAIGQLLRNSGQQQFGMHNQVFVHSLASVMPRGQRSMPLLLSLLSGYIAPAGSTKETRYAARQNRLLFKRQVIQLRQALTNGQPADLSGLPGYREDAQALANEQNGPTAGAPLTGGILDYAHPSQVPQ